jgi:spermidine synthase
VGVKGSLLTAAVLSSVASVILASIATRVSGAPAFWRSPEALIIPISLGAIILIPAASGTPLGLGQIYYFQSSAQYRLASEARKTLYQSEGIYSRVTVVENGAGVKTLSNGALDEGTNGNVDRTTTTMLAVVPAASTSSTQTALVVGLGTGYTSETYRKLGFKHVTTVEINPDVIPASSHFVGPIPKNDPQWNVIIDDARAHILTNPETYDTITSEPSWPWSSGVAALFTKEFISAAKTRLNPGGVYCQWLPNYVLKPGDVKMMYKTMREVYPRVEVWAINFPGDPQSELLLIGYNDASGRPTDEVKARIDAFAKIVAPENPLVTPETVTVYRDLEGLQQALQDPKVPLNTDDHSTLEYRVFWNFLNNALAAKAGG